MAKIYKTTDRIGIKLAGVELRLSPLTFDQKAEIQAMAVSGDFKKSLEAAKLAVKYSVKEVTGLEYTDGSAFEAKFENGVLTEESVDELMNIPQNDTLSLACLNLIKGVPDTFVSPFDGSKLDGVSFIKESSGKKK